MKASPASVLRFAPITMRRSDLARFHGNDERIAVADYMRAIGFYERLMPPTLASPSPDS